MKKLFSTVTLLIFFFAAPFCIAAPISARAALNLVKSKGSGEALRVLYGNGDSDSDAWQSTTTGIASGSEAWLEVARQLFPIADAGAASELLDSVAFALPKKPERVLSIIDADQADWQVVCSGPPGDKAPEGYFDEAMAAVRRVSSPKLERIKILCLGLLGEAAKRDRK